MKKIEDPFIIEKYYNELNMQEIFINDVTKHMKLLKFDKYEYLSREEEDLEYLLFFIQGKAKVFKTLPNGRNLLLAFYNSIRVIGDIEIVKNQSATSTIPVSYTHLRAHETVLDLVCRLLLETKQQTLTTK